MDARGNAVFRGRFLVSSPESSEDEGERRMTQEQFDYNLAAQMSEHEWFSREPDEAWQRNTWGGIRIDTPEHESHGVETQTDPRQRRYRASRDHGRRRQEPSPSRHFFSNLVGSLQNSLRDIAQAVKPTGGRGGSRAEDPLETDMMMATKEFQRLRPPFFEGSANPKDAVNWLKKINRRLDVLCITDEARRVALATFQLEGDADAWWDVAQQSVGHSWKKFEEAFMEQYIPKSAVEEMRLQFENLTQGDKTVNEYTKEFLGLSRFTRELIPDEKMKCRRFQRGLRPSIKRVVVTLRHTVFTELLETARAAESDNQSFQKEKQTEKIKGGSTSKGGGRKNQKRRGSSPDSGSERPKKSGSTGSSSRGSGRSANSKSVECYLCKQPGHTVTYCSSLGKAQAVVSAPRSQHQGAGGSSTDKRKDLVCYRCKQPGHFANKCPVMSTSTGSESTQQSQFRPPLQPFRGGGRGGAQQKGRMSALEMILRLTSIISSQIQLSFQRNSSKNSDIHTPVAVFSKPKSIING